MLSNTSDGLMTTTHRRLVSALPGQDRLQLIGTQQAGGDEIAADRRLILALTPQHGVVLKRIEEAQAQSSSGELLARHPLPQHDPHLGRDQKTPGYGQSADQGALAPLPGQGGDSLLPGDDPAQVQEFSQTQGALRQAIQPGSTKTIGRWASGG